MNRRLKRIAFAGALTACLTGAFAATASATYHLNYIREVHETPTADYVELQAYAAGQNFVAGKHIVTYDGGGGVLTDYTIPSNVSNGANQATILIANAPSVNGVAADFQAGNGGTGAGNLNVDNTGGTVCYTDSSITVPLDCVAFQGAMPIMVPFAGAQFGAPFQLPGANLNGQSLIRTISRGCATALDTADDTNSAADFTLGAGSPRNNASPITETACPTQTGTTTTTPKCKKKKKHHSAAIAKHKKCKKKKKH
jgi:hypothetical protein